LTQDQDLTAALIGAVLIEARHISLEEYKIDPALRRTAWILFRELGKDCDKSTTLDRVEHVLDHIFSSFREAVFDAVSYFKLREIWHREKQSLSDVDTVVFLTHRYGNGVPIGLYNCFKIIDSYEFKMAFKSYSSEVKSAFEKAFPNVSFARNAVAHEHDRNLGKALNKGKLTLLETSINLAAIAENGYQFVGIDGTVFTFEFNLERFRSFWSEFTKILEKRCA
jgi:hypothetical protein